MRVFSSTFIAIACAVAVVALLPACVMAGAPALQIPSLPPLQQLSTWYIDDDTYDIRFDQNNFVYYCEDEDNSYCYKYDVSSYPWVRVAAQSSELGNGYVFQIQGDYLYKAQEATLSTAAILRFNLADLSLDSTLTLSSDAVYFDDNYAGLASTPDRLYLTCLPITNDEGSGSYAGDVVVAVDISNGAFNRIGATVFPVGSLECTYGATNSDGAYFICQDSDLSCGQYFAYVKHSDLSVDSFLIPNGDEDYCDGFYGVALSANYAWSTYYDGDFAMARVNLATRQAELLSSAVYFNGEFDGAYSIAVDALTNVAYATTAGGSTLLRLRESDGLIIDAMSLPPVETEDAYVTAINQQNRRLYIFGDDYYYITEFALPPASQVTTASGSQANAQAEFAGNSDTVSANQALGIGVGVGVGVLAVVIIVVVIVTRKPDEVPAAEQANQPTATATTA